MSVGLFSKLGGAALKAGGWAVANPKTAAIVVGVPGWFIYNTISGKGLVDVAGKQVFGNTYEEEGLGGVLKQGVTGEKHSDQGMVEGLTDIAMGEGTYQRIGNTAGQVVDSVGNGVRAARDAAGNLISGVGDTVQGVVQGMGGGQQQVPLYADPNTGYYPQQTVANGGANMFTSPFSSLASMVGGMMGMGNTSPMNLAALIASGFLMFGNFGWMGKVISLLTGNMALKSMRQQPAYVMPQQQSYYPQQQYQPAVMPQQEAQNDNAVFRRRM